MSPRRAVKQELTREMIMNAARDLFIKQGYQHTSMRKIAAELGYSHGSIYYHFKNKAELFYAMVEQDFQLLDQRLDETIAQNLQREEQLKAVLLGFIEFGLRNQSHYEIMFLIKDEELKECLADEPNASYDKFANVISSLCNGKVSIMTIWSVFLSLHGFVSHYCRNVQTFEDVQDLAKAHVNFIAKSLRM
ncbi:bacterial regulatory s, tetR family protein [Bacillus pseudomycoides]|uniref:TetR/AcrR family transcriptional regulator n=1 Tax=Bacillus TaxID=1386 RepID=UPI0003726B64|nr:MULTISPECIES: TetR/AcrR family transcriptional regulator [Bacillus]AIK37679.1 bacterial regulatory s, tetR family protein [Bacillus pseudomycoides]AJI15565.1 bacterial regulatory s, tetR family protein [Bacillus pseudomycoides]MEB3053390.1 TetR/AcrR family transcriptional regulator [Bacillus pseudomycoides]PEP57174.1 TetR/AcrR family transcriptional regulator [Bacillus pseudomycoides]PGS06583.1 TetR/AcrR family transcriptional regulator [Bacillus pseudomycoides]